MPSIRRRVKYALWALSGRIGPRVSHGSGKSVTVLVTYFDPGRLGHLNAQVRNILKCRFVDRLVLSSHNPAVRLEDRVRVRDPRVVTLRQDVARGCGHRWLVAESVDAEYLIVLDDDVLVFPRQLARLFDELVREPGVPHGFAGMIRSADGSLEYHERQNRSVDFLCEAYAITRGHLQRFLRLRQDLASDQPVTHMIDSAADFVLLSRTGGGPPRIHDVGRLFRCETFTSPAIAVHKRGDFTSSVMAVDAAVSRVLSSASLHTLHHGVGPSGLAGPLPQNEPR